jgi:hypothetical protein
MLACMTAQHDEPPVAGRPAETPAAIRAVLAASAAPGVVAQYEIELDAAFARARETGDLRVLTAAVRRWWIEALEWQRDPAGSGTSWRGWSGISSTGRPGLSTG